MDRHELMTTAAAWMYARGWKEKLAKRRVEFTAGPERRRTKRSRSEHSPRVL